MRMICMLLNKSEQFTSAGKEAALTELLSLEPREAGTDEVEPSVEFTREWDDLHDSGRCQATRPHITIGCG